MKRPPMFILLGAVAGLVVSLHAQTRPVAAPAVEVVGLSIAKPRPSQPGEMDMGRSLVFGRRAGTSVATRLVLPDKLILEMDDDASKIASFSDAKGANLEPETGFSGMSAQVSDDGHEISVELNARKVPTQGALKLKVQGSLALLVGSDEKTMEIRNVALKKGQKFTIGKTAVEIADVKDSDFGNSKLSLTLQSKQSLKVIKSITFLDAAGKDIPAESMGGGSIGFKGDMTYTRDYGLQQKAGQATLKIVYFDKTTRITIPYNLEVGLGL